MSWMLQLVILWRLAPCARGQDGRLPALPSARMLRGSCWSLVHAILVASTCARVSRQPFVLGEATRDEAGVAVVDEIVRGRGGLVVAGVIAEHRLLVAHVLQGVPCLLSGFRLLVPLTQEGQYTVVPLQRGARPLGSHT